MALADKTYQQSLIDAAVERLPDWTADRFNEFMSEEVARWTPLVRKLGLLKLLEQFGLIASGDARPCVADRYMERAVIRFGLNGNFARIGELDGVPDKID